MLWCLDKLISLQFNRVSFIKTGKIQISNLYYYSLFILKRDKLSHVFINGCRLILFSWADWRDCKVLCQMSGGINEMRDWNAGANNNPQKNYPTAQSSALIKL